MSKRILVVEDQEDNRTILRDLRTSASFEVFEAVHAHRAGPQSGEQQGRSRSAGP